jgi:hypothetical protein
MALAETFDCPERPVLRVAGEGEMVCQDCYGSLVVEDYDGSVSGTVGSLIDCLCVELAVPPGFVECHGCAALVPVNGAQAARHTPAGILGVLRCNGHGAGAVPAVWREPTARQWRPCRVQLRSPDTRDRGGRLRLAAPPGLSVGCHAALPLPRCCAVAGGALSTADRSRAPSRPGRPIPDGFRGWVKGRRGAEVRPVGAGALGSLGTSAPCP